MNAFLGKKIKRLLFERGDFEIRTEGKNRIQHMKVTVIPFKVLVTSAPSANPAQSALKHCPSLKKVIL